MTRSFFTTLFLLILMCSTGYFYWRQLELQAENQVLSAKVSALQRQLEQHHRGHGHHERESANQLSPPLDPSQSAQIHLTNAERAISQGNVGDAVNNLKLAGADIQAASQSTSQSVRDAVGGLKQKLDSLQQETSGLWKKLGG